jgi:hypothetical protein
MHDKKAYIYVKRKQKVKHKMPFKATVTLLKIMSLPFALCEEN